jgi:hypothetical protein
MALRLMGGREYSQRIKAVAQSLGSGGRMPVPLIAAGRAGRTTVASDGLGHAAIYARNVCGIACRRLLRLLRFYPDLLVAAIGKGYTVDQVAKWVNNAAGSDSLMLGPYVVLDVGDGRGSVRATLQTRAGLESTSWVMAGRDHVGVLSADRRAIIDSDDGRIRRKYVFQAFKGQIPGSSRWRS